MNNEQTLTASGIRFLLAMKSITDSGQAPRGVHLAGVLHCSHPSINKMIRNLSEKKLLDYRAYDRPAFTAEGLLAAQRYEEYYMSLRSMLPASLVGEEEPSSALCAFLAMTPESIHFNSLGSGHCEYCGESTQHLEEI